MMEMAALGGFLGWIGGRPRDTMIGAGLGLVAGTMFLPLNGHTGLMSGASLGLVAGASDGAMLRPYLRIFCGVFRAATRSLGWASAG
jgi:hypothetical protein